MDSHHIVLTYSGRFAMGELTPNNKYLIKSYMLIFILVILLIGCAYNPEPGWKPAQTTHDAILSGTLQMLWVRPEVFIEISWGDINLAASDDRVIILGSLDIGENSGVNALDVFNGDPVWKTDPIPPSTLFVNQNELYVGEAGGGSRITSYDLDTGEVSWSRIFLISSGVESLIVYKNQLHAYIAPDMHKVLNTSNGKTVFSILPKSPPFIDSTICGETYQIPVYTDDTIYYRTGKDIEMGKVCALDITTGELRWKSDLNVVSNVIATDDEVFILVESGDLIALNPANGEEISTLKVSFSNKPFILYSPKVEVGGYFVAYDTEKNILLTYLGDSRQLFAFQVR
jgi:outer membrane protein assembly factor BamB